MRIYTEVIFEWDDKQGKLVETSSKSFDYQGEMALCDVQTNIWYDEDGNKYKHTYTYTHAPLRADESYFYKWNEDDSTWSQLGHKGKQHLGLAEHNEWGLAQFQTYGVGTKSFGTKLKSQQWKAGEMADAGASWQDILEETDLYNPEYVTGEGTQGMNITDWVDQGEGYVYPEGVVEDDGGYSVTADLEHEETMIAQTAELWKDIISPDLFDDFQADIDAETKMMEFRARDVSEAYGDILGEAETLQREMWLDKVQADKDYLFEMGLIDKQYTEDVDAVTGAAIVDEDGNIISEGTYTAEMRLALLERDEGLGDLAAPREEAYETLRETATAEIREAEAKRAASGFAASGVGHTAREQLAADIGERAEEIEEGITEERTGITSTYDKAVVAAETSKSSALAGLLSKYEDAGSILLTEKNDAIAGYLRDRDKLGEDLTDPWKDASDLYSDELEVYTDITVPGIAYEAEKELGAYHGDIWDMIEAARLKLAEGTKEQKDIAASWSPFVEGASLAGRAGEFGWIGYGAAGRFDPTFTKGLFASEYDDPYTLEGIDYLGAYDAYAAPPDMQLYDPEVGYTPPWEADPDWLLGEFEEDWPEKPGDYRPYWKDKGE